MRPVDPQISHKAPVKASPPKKEVLPFTLDDEDDEITEGPPPPSLFVLAAARTEKEEALSRVNESIGIALEKLAVTLRHMERNGIETMTVELEHPNNPLDGTHFHIKQFDTAPTQFSISIETTPEGQLFLARHLPSLHAGLAEALPHCTLSIDDPKLLPFRRDKKVKKVARK